MSGAGESRRNRRKKAAVKDSAPALKSAGNCVTMNVADTKTFEKVLTDYYYNTTAEDDPNVQCDWYSISADTLLIKYNNSLKDFTATLTLFHATGCVSIQGQRNHCQTWINEHYPKLFEMYRSWPPKCRRPPKCRSLQECDFSLQIYIDQCYNMHYCYIRHAQWYLGKYCHLQWKILPLSRPAKNFGPK